MQFKDVRQVEWADVVEAIEQCYALGWTDGLPVVPPTVERVNTFLEYVRRAPDEVLGTLPERRREITVGKVAANAVMAGCKPEYFRWSWPRPKPYSIPCSISLAPRRARAVRPCSPL